MARFRMTRQGLFAVAGIALLAALGWVASVSGPLATTRVTVARVATGELAPEAFGIGTVGARRSYAVGPTAAGRIRRVLVEVGDAVLAGQVLAEIDPVDLESRVASADAAVARAGSAEAASRAQLDDAATRLKLAAAEAHRYRGLAQKGFVSASALETREQQRESAAAQLAAAEHALAGARQETARTEAERRAARQQRANLRLLAPAAGMVTSREAEPGTTVVAGQAVVKLVDPDSVWVSVRLDQRRSAGVVAGTPASIVLRSNPAEAHAGRVVRVEPLSDAVTEERIVQIAFDRRPPVISIGEMAEATLRLSALRDVLLVPNAALRQRDAGTGVWRRADGRLAFVAVKTGERSLDGRVRIVSGLAAGDEIVVHSERDLDEASRIEVVAALRGNAK